MATEPSRKLVDESTVIRIDGHTCTAPDNCHHCGNRILSGSKEFLVTYSLADQPAVESLACATCVVAFRRKQLS